MVAGIKDISKIKKYEISGSPVSEDEVEIEIETPIKFLSSGVLVEAIKLPTEESK
ncbi:hypothetical protein QUF80_10555 [Desulfococcaceae bacterium HSG8]|nr:hypothetical protein [Desulfococcaceae bacterium HSG8]